jgi:hypothetical protein
MSLGRRWASCQSLDWKGCQKNTKTDSLLVSIGASRLHAQTGPRSFDHLARARTMWVGLLDLEHLLRRQDALVQLMLLDPRHVPPLPDTTTTTVSPQCACRAPRLSRLSPT